MEKEQLGSLVKSKKTLLGAGPMSLNCIDAAIEAADEYDVPVMLIASRRQIDDKNIQAGYVNSWSTEDFAQYVRSRQKKNNIILARDHGGPWQNNIEIEKKLSLNDALKSAEESFSRDIDAGFNILHIDPSIDIFKTPSFDEIFERLIRLYQFCSDYAEKAGKNIEFEIGTEEQAPHINDAAEFGAVLDRVNSFCAENGLKKPLFAVAQIGTKVMETRNIGILNSAEGLKENTKSIKELCACAEARGIGIKVHNTDYLPSDVLQAFPDLGIAAANIAPEFGAAETKALLNLFEERGLKQYADEFLNISYNSKKWEKWVIKDSDITNREKAALAGHYVFSDERVIKLKEKAQKQMKDIDIDCYLKEAVKQNIMQYMEYFNILKEKAVYSKC